MRLDGWEGRIFRSTVNYIPVAKKRASVIVRGMSEVDKEEQFARRMAALGVHEADITETFVRSGGHGGQNVNKTSTCVMVTHGPTGLQVKCQETRQQGQNRALARKLLLDKIDGLQETQRAAERARMEKLRRQKRGRSRAAKERILKDKSRNSMKKSFRRGKGDE